MSEEIKAENRRLKVMLVEPLGDGGIAHYTYNLARALDESGLDVHLFTTRRYELEDRVKGRFTLHKKMFSWAFALIGIFPRVDRETPFWSLVRRCLKLAELPVNLLQLAWLAVGNRIECAHLQSVNVVDVASMIALKACGRRVIITFHNLRPLHKPLRGHHKLIYRLMYQLCDKMIIHSEHGKREMMEILSSNGAKIAVVAHGDYNFFAEDFTLSPQSAKTMLGIPTTSKTVLFFGAIRANKGLDFLLRAMPRVCRGLPEAKLMIVGEPSGSFSEYDEMIEAANLRNNVLTRLDYVAFDEVGLYFSAADLVVLPYREITHSGVLQIAYAFGKPVVATELPGFRETISDGDNGRLVPAESVGALADAMLEILSQAEVGRRMGVCSKQMADENFSWRTIATQTIALYDNA